ncbi:hypothetical protein OAF98_02850, partial [Planctomicrobium sp.]
TNLSFFKTRCLQTNFEVENSKMQMGFEISQIQRLLFCKRAATFQISEVMGDKLRVDGLELREC